MCPSLKLDVLLSFDLKLSGGLWPLCCHFVKNTASVFGVECTFWYFWPANLHTKKEKAPNLSSLRPRALSAFCSIQLYIRSDHSITLCSRSGFFYYSLKVYCHTEGQEVLLVILTVCVREEEYTSLCVYTVVNGAFLLQMHVSRLN